MYEDLVKQIQELLNKQAVVVVAISGHGGSGKSTLADRLGQEFGVEKHHILRMDSFYAKNYEKAKGLFEGHDWPVIMDLLSHVHESNRLTYKTRDWKEVEGSAYIDRPKLVLFEGVRLIRPETVPYFDLSVWIDCPIEVATKRAKDRNRQQGDSEAELALWDTKWLPEAKLYIEQVHPEKIANINLELD